MTMVSLELNPMEFAAFEELGGEVWLRRFLLKRATYSPYDPGGLIRKWSEACIVKDDDCWLKSSQVLSSFETWFWIAHDRKPGKSEYSSKRLANYLQHRYGAIMHKSGTKQMIGIRLRDRSTELVDGGVI